MYRVDHVFVLGALCQDGLWVAICRRTRTRGERNELGAFQMDEWGLAQCARTPPICPEQIMVISIIVVFFAERALWVVL